MKKNPIIGLLAACLLLPAGSAHAVEVVTAESSEIEPLTCVQHITSGSYECFQDLDAYVADRTGGKQLGIASAPGGIPASDVDAISKASVASTVITAIFWNGYGQQGAMLIMEAPHGCDAHRDIDWSWRSIRPDWENRIESGQGYSKCQLKVWDLVDYKGASFGGRRHNFLDRMGAMANEAESVRMF